MCITKDTVDDKVHEINIYNWELERGCPKLYSFKMFTPVNRISPTLGTRTITISVLRLDRYDQHLKRELVMGCDGESIRSLRRGRISRHWTSVSGATIRRGRVRTRERHYNLTNQYKWPSTIFLGRRRRSVGRGLIGSMRKEEITTGFHRGLVFFCRNTSEDVPEGPFRTRESREGRRFYLSW